MIKNLFTYCIIKKYVNTLIARPDSILQVLILLGEKEIPPAEDVLKNLRFQKRKGENSY